MQQKNKAPYYAPASIKDIDAKQGIVTGYFANFGTLDADNDIIMQGAFTKTINERGPKSAKPRIKYLLDHNTSKALGVITSLSENAQGLKYEAQAGSHALGQDFVKMVDSGIITEHSFGYSVTRKQIANPEADWKDQQTQLIELQMWEGSPLQTWGANANTPLLGMKSRVQVYDRIDTLIKAIRSGTFTDKTFIQLEKELIFLQEAIKSDFDFTSPELETTATTTPNDEGKMLNVLTLMNANMEMRLRAIH